MAAVVEQLKTTDGEPAPPPRPARESRAPQIFVAALTAIFTLVFSYLILYRHAHLGTRAFDLGIFDQGLWMLSEGKEPFLSIRGLNLFSDHSSYIMLPLVPLYWIWADVRVLLILTVLAMAAGGPLMYQIGRAEGLSRRMSAAAAAAFLLMPAVQWQIWDAFHPETLTVPLLLGAYLAAARRRPWWALALLAVALTAKEDVGLVVVPLALLMGWRFRSRLIGAGGALLGMLALYVNFYVLLPALSPTGEAIYAGRYGEFGDSFTSIVWGALTSPGDVVSAIFVGRNLLYLAALLLPLVVALAAPEALLVAGPTLAANMFSTHTYQAEVEYHYTAYVIVALSIGAVIGAKRIGGWLQPRGAPWLLAAIIVVPAAIGTVAAGPWGPSMGPWAGGAVDPEAVSEALALIPPDARVTADFRLVTHLAHRDTIYVFPNPVIPRNYSAAGIDEAPKDDFDWLVVRADLEGMYDEFMIAYEHVVTSGEFERVLLNNEVAVWQRIAAPGL